MNTIKSNNWEGLILIDQVTKSKWFSGNKQYFQVSGAYFQFRKMLATVFFGFLLVQERALDNGNLKRHPEKDSFLTDPQREACPSISSRTVDARESLVQTIYWNGDRVIKESVFPI